MTDPVLFLDIDGVLNHYAWLTGPEVAEAREAGMPKPLRDLDPTPIKQLNRIAAATGCKVVISSTWRLLHDLDLLVQMLAHRGAAIDVIGATPHLVTEPGHGGLVRAAPRGEEIAAWRATHGHTGPFVALDDDDDMDAIPGHYVQTSFMHGGLTMEHADRAIAILQG